LKQADGSWTTDSYFDAFICKRLICYAAGCDLLDRMVYHGGVNSELCKPFTDEEIIKALFQIGPLKAPRPDGLAARFFQ
jgi:hypothetical protein